MKKILPLLLVAVLALSLTACSSTQNEPSTNTEQSTAQTVKVDTTGMTKEEVEKVAHIYFDMYPARAAFYGASAEQITTLSENMIQYIDSQAVTNSVLANYLKDFKAVYQAAVDLGSDSENTDNQEAVKESSLAASNNVIPLRSVCDQFGVQWVYFWQEEVERGGVYYTFKDGKTKEIKDDNGNLTGNKFLKVEVSAKNITSHLNQGWDLIDFQLMDAESGTMYQMDKEETVTKTIVDHEIEMGKKARAVLAYEVPSDLNLYVLVLDMSSWNDESNPYLRMAHYTLF